MDGWQWWSDQEGPGVRSRRSRRARPSGRLRSARRRHERATASSAGPDAPSPGMTSRAIRGGTRRYVYRRGPVRTKSPRETFCTGDRARSVSANFPASVSAVYRLPAGR
eukprot:TRINITY_DN21189_c0_g1_i1.p3 TRINITY_DN21189_c0_g1~~TRINITY_DN21189_c0_g1_i1.p3  ORF type:complete len:109 (-),score=0.72 TRINITY_DN21189_c0_g1_i1:102-428(-)